MDALLTHILTTIYRTQRHLNALLHGTFHYIQWINAYAQGTSSIWFASEVLNTMFNEESVSAWCVITSHVFRQKCPGFGIHGFVACSIILHPTHGCELAKHGWVRSLILSAKVDLRNIIACWRDWKCSWKLVDDHWVSASKNALLTCMSCLPLSSCIKLHTVDMYFVSTTEFLHKIMQCWQVCRVYHWVYAQNYALLACMLCLLLDFYTKFFTDDK